MEKRNLFFAIGGIFGSLLDIFLTFVVIMFTLALKSCVGESGDTTKLDIVATITCLVLIFSCVSAIITSIKGFSGRKVPLVYLLLSQIAHFVIAIALIVASIGNDDSLFFLIISVLCIIHFFIYIAGQIKQKKNFKIE